MEIKTLGAGSCISDTSGTVCFDTWGDIKRVSVAEVGETVEMIYLQTSNISYYNHPPRPPERKVFKIVYSCKDGKWNKSDRIYGTINSPIGESYSFK